MGTCRRADRGAVVERGGVVGNNLTTGGGARSTTPGSDVGTGPVAGAPIRGAEAVGFGEVNAAVGFADALLTPSAVTMPNMVVAPTLAATMRLRCAG